MTPTILFVDRRSIYKKMGLDCYDIDRDACTYAGPHPVVAHPPCRLWGSFRFFTTAPLCEKLTGLNAVLTVRQFGGVLEHPRNSLLWQFMGLPLPGRGGGIDSYGGFTIDVDQHWWGHRAKKNTWLYIVGCNQNNLPPIPLSLNAITHKLSKNNYRHLPLKELSAKGRSATPPAFAQWLVDTATLCRGSGER